MNWWHEEMKRDDPFGIPLIFLFVAYFVSMTLIPLILIAIGMSFIVPVEPWVVVLVILAGWPIQWRLMPREYATFAVRVGAGAAWVFGAFVASHLLGPVPAIAVIVAAPAITIWALGRLEDAAEAAAAEASVDAFRGRRPR